MNLDNWLKLIDAVTKLLTVLVWPAIILFVLLRFSSAIRDFLANLGEFTLKGAGIDVSAKRNQATAALAAAAVARAEATPESAAADARQAVEVVSEKATPTVMRRAAGAKILWVDDNPGNNTHERQSLEALGVRFVLARSTEEGIAALQQEKFDLIISDMNRPPDSKAGYTLLESLRKAGDQTPYIIYASSRSAANQLEARSRGAIGCTNSPNELFGMVLSVLGRL